MLKQPQFYILLIIIIAISITEPFIINQTTKHHYKKINNNLHKEVQELTEEIFKLHLARTVDSQVLESDTPQQKTIKLAQFVATNICNDLKDIPLQDFTSRKTYTTRRGLCAARSWLLKDMLKVEGIHSEIFNLYNFGGPGGAHTAIQVWYDAKWHYFDPTYGGYFQKKDGAVLSWSEIQENPKLAISMMKVFPYTCDYYDTNTKNAPVNNTHRMQGVYSLKSLLNPITSAGFHEHDTFVLKPSIPASALPLRLGKADDSQEDVNKDALSAKLSEQLGNSLNTENDHFSTRWQFEGLSPGRRYIIDYHLLHRGKTSPIPFEAKSTNAKIVSGQKSPTQKSQQHWVIAFIPESNAPVQMQIQATTLQEMGRGFRVDEILIQSHP